MRDKRLDYLRLRHTVNGQAIVISKTQSQNWLRAVMSEVQYHLELFVQHLPDGTEMLPDQWPHLLAVVTALEANFSNPLHYGDNKPGLFDSERFPLLPDPVFTYWDLWQFGVTGEDGHAGFLRLCGLPEETTEAVLLIATGLLLIDDAVTALESGKEAFAGYLVHQATECVHEVRLLSWNAMNPTQLKQAILALLSERGRAAGRESGKRRMKAARAKPGEVRSARDKLKTEGKSPREISSILATRFNVTSDHIRKVLRKPA